MVFDSRKMKWKDEGMWMKRSKIEHTLCFSYQVHMHMRCDATDSRMRCDRLSMGLLATSGITCMQPPQSACAKAHPSTSPQATATTAPITAHSPTTPHRRSKRPNPQACTGRLSFSIIAQHTWNRSRINFLSSKFARTLTSTRSFALTFTL